MQKALQKPRVVILGAGFGGLTAARKMAGFADVHPLQPIETVQGAFAVIHELAHWLVTLTGMKAVAMSPNWPALFWRRAPSLSLSPKGLLARALSPPPKTALLRPKR
jgi:glycine dehydrogenase subunit 2